MESTKAHEKVTKHVLTNKRKVNGGDGIDKRICPVANHEMPYYIVGLCKT